MGQFFLGRVILGVATVLDSLLWFYGVILFIAIILSFVSPDPRNPIVMYLRAITDPVLYWVRRRLPFVVVGRLDLSPLVVFLAILFIRTVLVGTLMELAYRISALPRVIHVG